MKSFIISTVNDGVIDLDLDFAGVTLTHPQSIDLLEEFDESDILSSELLPTFLRNGDLIATNEFGDVINIDGSIKIDVVNDIPSNSGSTHKVPCVSAVESELSKKYSPTLTIIGIDKTKIGLNKTTSIIVSGKYMDFVENVNVSGSTDNNGLGVVIISKSYDSIIIDVTTNSQAQDLTLLLIAFDGSTKSLNIESLNIDVLMPSNGGSVLWQNKTGEATNPNNTGYGFIQKPSTSGGWNTQATFFGVPANKDFELEITYKKLPASTTYGMFGMNISNTTSSYSDIDFAFYVNNSTNLYIYENGASRGFVGSINDGDVCKITRTNNVIKYFVNGELKRTVNNATTNAMIFDCSLYRSIRLENIKLIIFN